jgi:hypothetical protein
MFSLRYIYIVEQPTSAMGIAQQLQWKGTVSVLVYYIIASPMPN